MDRTTQRLDVARKALNTLKEIDLKQEPTTIVRDAVPETQNLASLRITI